MSEYIYESPDACEESKPRRDTDGDIYANVAVYRRHTVQDSPTVQKAGNNTKNLFTSTATRGLLQQHQLLLLILLLQITTTMTMILLISLRTLQVGCGVLGAAMLFFHMV